MKKLQRTINKQHDYVLMCSEFEIMHNMIENANRKTFDSVQNYIDLKIKTIGTREGLRFLGKLPYRVIAAFTGARQYHINFLISLEKHIDFISQELNEKAEKLQNETNKIGFKK